MHNEYDHRLGFAGQGKTAVSPHQSQPTLTIFAQSNDKETVRAKRRRGTSSKAGERERADAPRRRRPSGGSGGSGGSSGGGGLPSGGGGLPQMPGGGRIPPVLLIILVVVFLVCGLPIMRFLGIDLNDVAQQVEQAQPPASSNQPASSGGEVAQPAEPIEDFVPPVPATGEGQTWTIMLYQNADDKVLEQDIFVDLNEAEKVGSTDRVQIVAQLDRYRGGYAGDGDWTTARRYYVTQDDDLNRIGSQLVEDVGEVNMADGQALVDFVRWSAENFPADKYVLIMSDHGIGWPGGWGDPTAPSSPADRNIPLTSALGDQLYLNELDDVLAQVREETGIDQFEIVGMDACLMGHVEVFSALAPHARYGVASQEVEPALGWAYAGFLARLVENPDMDGAELSTAIVDSYIVEDQRIVDDAARAEMTQRGSGMSGLFGLFTPPTPEQLAAQLGKNITLTAADLSQMPALMSSLNDFSLALQQVQQQPVAQARSYTQSYTSVFGRQVPPSYIDMGHFVQLVQERVGGDAAQVGNELLAAIDDVVVAEKNGPAKPAASGLSIYFPNSQLYANPATGPRSYTGIASRFAQTSLWDDFLTFHYTGRNFNDTAQELVVPDEGTAVRSPGAGQISISPITTSGDVAAPGQPVLLSADISGDNVGYVFFFAGFLDEAGRSIFVADTDYLDSSDTREINGAFYPVWPENEFTLEFEWEPIVFAISDGENTEVALFNPETYGATQEEAIYSIEGIYTFADGEERPSRLLFQDGGLLQVLGFTGDGSAGAPREIIPESGDSFTIIESWLDLDSTGRVEARSQQLGGTLTFGSQSFTQVELDAAVGTYVVGYIVTDLDGQRTEAYTTVRVE